MNQTALLIDFYALTMANAYYRFKPKAEATFDLFVRQMPKQRRFLVACGIEDALRFLRDFSFAKEDIDYLRGFNLQPGFLDYLSTLRFRGDVWALPEGTLVFPEEPILRVTAPLIQEYRKCADRDRLESGARGLSRERKTGL